MHFNIYIDDETGKRLQDVGIKSGLTRNALIRQAIDEWLQRHGESGWPAVVLDFNGVPDAPAFETFRSELGPEDEDPLA